MTLDRARYLEEVLKPARKSRQPPVDLFVRYGFTGRLPGGQEFGDQIKAVVAEWKKLENAHGWSEFIPLLLSQHSVLEQAGSLTSPDAFSKRREQDRAAAGAKLRDLVKDLNATHVGQARIALLRDEAGAGVDDEQVRKALADARIAVVDKLPALPLTEPARYAKLGPELRALGKALSAEVVFETHTVKAGYRMLDGFRLADGRRLDDKALKELEVTSARMSRSDPQKPHTETVRTILKSALDDGTLDQLLAWELIGPLRKQIDLRGQRGTAAQAVATGLDADEAGIIAAALVEQGSAGNRVQRIEEELAAGRLRSAQRLAAALPKDDELRRRLEASGAEVAELIARADAELSVSRAEEAARLLADAAQRATDDEDLPERLGRIAPPPPGEPAAVVDGDGARVVVTWRPSAARVGHVRYRVSRGIGRVPRSPAEGVAIAVADGELQAADQHPPPGEPLHYAVFASRGAEVWSAPAGTASLVVVPDVTGIELREGADSVSGSWRPPKGAAEILVARIAPGAQRPVRADLTGFHDTGLTPGTEYRYRISAVFLAGDGSTHASAGKIVRAVPVPAPVPVRELAVRSGPKALEVRWAPPRFGRVELWIGRAEPRWSPGEELSDADLTAFGNLLAGAQFQVGEQVAVKLPEQHGRRFLLAVTKAGQRAVAGARVKLDLATPISELSAKRLLDEAQLSWEWPAGAADSLITWPGRERRCSRRSYHDEGGVTVPIGPDECVVSVSALHPDPAGELVAPPVSVTVPARKPKVTYRWRKAGSRRRLLELSSDRSCLLPELVVVRSTASYPPGEVADGVEVARLSPVQISSGSLLAIPVDLPKGATGFLACFTASRDAPVLLFPPPPNEMRIR